MNRKLLFILTLFSAVVFLNGCGNQEVFYNIEWRNFDQTVLDTSVVKAGDIPEYHGDNPTREKDVQYTYTFSGWTPEVVPANQDTIYVATYKEITNQYSVTWKNYDGTVLDVESYNYGDTPSYKGSTPTKTKDAQYTYTFSNWSPEISNVTENTSYFAEYKRTTNQYSVTWKNYDGTVLDVESYNYGDTPSYKGSTPTKTKDAQYTYTFSNWSPKITMVKEDVVYYAEYNNVINSYFITWKNYDGTVLDIESYEYGELPHYKGVVPTKESPDVDYCYSFTGWDKDVVTVTKDDIYIAEFDYKYGYDMKLINNSYFQINKCYLVDSEYICVPSMYNKLPVKVIKANTFLNCKKAKSITIPNSFTSIESAVFKGCELLETVTLPFVGQSFKNYFDNGNTQISSVRNVIITRGDSIPDNCFSGCSSLTSITLPNSVTVINNAAFSGCTSLTSINIPDGITRIGNYAFSGCSSLTSITIPNSITTINECTFQRCKSLSYVKLSENIQYIYNSAFSGCSSLKSLTLPDSVIVIKSRAFEECASLAEVYFSNSLRIIDDYAFANCSSLKTIVLPNSIASLGKGSFSGCASLESITVPFIGDGKENNTYFGYIFGYESPYYLPKHTLPKTVILSNACQIIYKESFRGLIEIEKVVIPGSVKTVQADAFAICGSIQVNYIGSYEEWMGLSGKNNLINIHLFLDDSHNENETINIPSGTIKVDNYAFSGCTSLTSIIIPDSVTEISKASFSGCASLTSINIPDSVTSIGDYAFSDCTSLTSINIPDSVVSIGKYAFSGCASLISINIPDSVTSIGDYAFRDCTSLTSINIPDSATKIGGSILSGCKSLHTIKIPHLRKQVFGAYFDSFTEEGNYVTDAIRQGPVIFDGSCYYRFYYIPLTLEKVILTCIDDIPEYAFQNCNFIKQIELPDSVTSIGNFAFDNCSSIMSLTLSDGVTSIGDYAFSGCTSLTSINIPDSVTSIGDYAFRGCSSLTSINIPNGIIKIGNYTFWGCSLIKSISIPDGVTSIGDYAFSGCSSLTSINIPNSVTSIGDYAFSGCSSLASIAIPDSVTYLGTSVFYNCSSLSSVAIPLNVKTIYSFSFEYCNSLISIMLSDNIRTIEKDAFRGLDTSVFNKFDNAYYLGTKTNPYFALIQAKNYETCEINENCVVIANEAFAYCDSLTSITIPSSVKSIGDSAFFKCVSLISINIPDSVESIGDSAFSYCTSLTSIKLGCGLSKIGYCVFSDCMSMSTIIIPNSITFIDDNAFHYCSGLSYVYYEGTESEWNSINIRSIQYTNACLMNANRYFYSEFEPSEQGNYWHYIDDQPVIW